MKKTPTLGANSFSCPHCGALSHQSWSRLYVNPYDQNNGPSICSQEDIDSMEKNKEIPEELKDRFLKNMRKQIAGKPFLGFKSTLYDRYTLENVNISNCYSCNEIAVWLGEKLLYPEYSFVVNPNSDMPDDIAADFREAADILASSPRGAAALLRLCIQKICKHLGEPGKNINSDIASLVKKGLDTRVQRALDIVRVIGNEAVHPGSIDLNDNREIALKLFSLVNEVVEEMISKPARIDALYLSLPKVKIDEISRRDGGKTE